MSGNRGWRRSTEVDRFGREGVVYLSDCGRWKVSDEGPAVGWTGRGCMAKKTENPTEGMSGRVYRGYEKRRRRRFRLVKGGKSGS